MMNVTFLTFALIYSKGLEEIRTLEWTVTALIPKVDSSPTHGRSSLRAGDRKEKAKTPFGNFPQETFLSFKRPK